MFIMYFDIWLFFIVGAVVRAPNADELKFKTKLDGFVSFNFIISLPLFVVKKDDSFSTSVFMGVIAGVV